MSIDSKNENECVLLIVDDNEMNRDMLSRRLKRRGYETLVAEGGREALQILHRLNVDLVLLDIMMPEMSGIEVLRVIRETQTMADLPVIMVSAKDQSKDIVEALELGANDYVTKPVDFPVALARIRTQMLRKRAEEALRKSESKNRAMLRAIPDALFRLKRDGTLLDFKGNDSFAVPMSASAIGKKIEMMLPDDIGIPISQTVSETLQQEAVQVIELETAQDGQEFDFEIRVVVSGTDEVLVLIRDITERKKVERLRNEFISILSHDLRSSLTSIRGALSLIELRTAGELPGHVNALVNIAHKNSDRLVRLINDLLDLERMESGKMELQQQEVQLKPLILQTIESCSATQQDKQRIRFVLEEDSHDATVLADSDRIAQVVTSLLVNAARFSPEDGLVQVHIIQPEEGLVRVSVTDSGPTIPEAFRNRIFQKVSHAGAGVEGQQDDETGLGLSLSKVIIEKLNGRIGFSAREEGGNTFFFELPTAEFRI